MIIECLSPKENIIDVTPSSRETKHIAVYLKVDRLCLNVLKCAATGFCDGLVLCNFCAQQSEFLGSADSY